MFEWIQFCCCCCCNWWIYCESLDGFVVMVLRYAGNIIPFRTFLCVYPWMLDWKSGEKTKIEPNKIFVRSNGFVHLASAEAMASSIPKTKAINIRTLEKKKNNERNNERYQAKIKTSWCSMSVRLGCWFCLFFVYFSLCCFCCCSWSCASTRSRFFLSTHQVWMKHHEHTFALCSNPNKQTHIYLFDVIFFHSSHT